tara:strand:- start:19 stop:837 length:819 start_codon:yes stop_codon:yes gene_type:complete
MRNIVRDGAWTTLSTSSKLRAEAPRVMVTPYKLSSTAIKQAVKGFIAANSDNTDQFYNELYTIEGSKKGAPVSNGDPYFFPYFNDDFRSFTSEFADTLSNISDRGTVSVAQMLNDIGGEAIGAAAQVVDFMENVKSAFKGDGGPSTGTYIETPKFYQFDNTDAPLSVTFPLLNTVNPDVDIAQNQAFIKEFTIMNRPERLSAARMNFPHVYSVKIPGLRFIKWAYCDNLSFSMVGQRREIGGKIVPEAYQCNMSFKSLTVEVSNFLGKGYLE